MPNSNYHKRLREGAVAKLKALSVTFVVDPAIAYVNSKVGIEVYCKNACGEIVTVLPNNLIKRGGVNCNTCRYIGINQKYTCPKWFRVRFAGIKQRCTDTKCKTYKNYGGRGIKLLFNSPDEMWEYVSTLPNCSKDLTIDRIDNNIGYAKGNIRWVSSYIQNINTRKESIGVRQSNNSPRWQARITIYSKDVHLGTYPSKAEAIAAVEKAKQERKTLYINEESNQNAE